MKKVSYILLAVGIALIGLAIIFLARSPKKTLDESNWKVISGNNAVKVITGMDINCNCDAYDYENFNRDYLYATDGSENSYWYVIPNNETLIKTENSYEYDGEINISFGSTIFNNIDNHVLDGYAENINSKVYIKKNVVDATKTAILAKIIDADGNNYREELTIYFHNEESSYTYVKYTTDGNKFSDKTIEKLITGAYKDKEKAKFTTCNKENNDYACTISASNKKVSFKVDSTKYSLQINEKYANYQETFVNVDDNINDSINISISLNDEMNWLSDYDKKEVSIGGKDLVKYNKDTNNAYYVIELDDVTVIVNVYSEKNSLDDIAKDFVNYTVSK